MENAAMNCVRLDEVIAKFDLLKHPFYQAWSAGELSAEDLARYACEYYAHVAAFPTYLSALHQRLEDGALRRNIAANLADEEGIGSRDDRSHAELWLDFAEAMGAEREDASATASIPEVQKLVAHFSGVATEGDVVSALAAFYAYESQVPRVAVEKARGLREQYGADDRACRYFDVHKTADVHHARVWSELLEKCVTDEAARERAEVAAEEAAQALWTALDGIERERRVRRGLNPSAEACIQ